MSLLLQLIGQTLFTSKAALSNDQESFISIMQFTLIRYAIQFLSKRKIRAYKTKIQYSNITVFAYCFVIKQDNGRDII
ncbi:hypothetical protein ACH3XW_33520 [Acanthocheilonema viteae]